MSSMRIHSKIQDCDVHFVQDAFATLHALTESKLVNSSCVYLIDSNVAKLYKKQLQPIFDTQRCVYVEANEENKSFHRLQEYMQQILAIYSHKDLHLIAIGGGITLDLTGLVASLLFRGVGWSSFPTTLLSQADSCIGGKTAVNFQEIKNIIGTFYPAKNVYIDTHFLHTLPMAEIHSGIGEIIKSYLLEGAFNFSDLKDDLSNILNSNPLPNQTFNDSDPLLKKLIKHSLQIKKRLIEIDEFDKNERRLLNFGHTFGHAIESASNFLIPHGIAVLMGIDMAANYSHKMGSLHESYLLAVCPTLRKYYQPFLTHPIDPDRFFTAIKLDKKNMAQSITLILPMNENGIPQQYSQTANEDFQQFCLQFLRK